LKNIILSTFNIPDEDGLAKLMKGLNDMPYTDERGFGFESIEADGDLISAILIKRNATYIYEYDAQSKEMVKRQIMLFSEISFEIDLEYHVLSVFGQAIYLTQLRSAFRTALNFNYEVGHTNLSPYHIYTTLLKKDVQVTFQSLCVEKFVYNNGISGKLIGQVIDDAVATELVETYKTDVNKALLKINIDDEHGFSLQVANNGAVKFHSTADTFAEHFNFFKLTLFK
jgi:hypothetical protein